MADVFFSYKTERRAAAEHLAKILHLYGYSSWYDYELLAGRDFGRQIDQQLRSAKAVIVLWCSKSVASEWVLDEAHVARKHEKLVPVRIEAAELPVGFVRLDTLDLTDWNGSPRSPILDRLLGEVARLVDRPPRPRFADLQSYEATWRTFGASTLAQFSLSKGLDEANLRHLSPASRARLRRGGVPRWILRVGVPLLVIAALLFAGLQLSGYSLRKDDPGKALKGPPIVSDSETSQTTEAQAASPPIDNADDPHLSDSGAASPTGEGVQSESAAAPGAAALLQPIVKFEPPAPANLVAISPTGSRLIAFSKEGNASVVDIPSGRVVSRAKLIENSGLMPPTFSPDGKKFLAMFHLDASRDPANGGSGWGLFDAATGSLIAPLDSQWLCREPVFSAGLEFIHGATVYDRYSAAPPMNSCETGVWSAADAKMLSDRKEVQMFGGFIGASRSYLSFERGDKQLKRMHLEPAADRVEKAVAFGENIQDVLISPSGRHAAVSLEGNMVAIVALPGLDTLYSVYSSASFGVQTPMFTEDGKRLLVRPAVAGREYELLEAATGKSVFRYPAGYYVSNSLYFDARNGLGSTGNLHFVDGGRMVGFAPVAPHYSYWTNSTAVVRDEILLFAQELISPNEPQEIYLLDVAQSASHRLAVPRDVGCHSFVFSRNFARAAAVCNDGSVRVWQTRRG